MLKKSVFFGALLLSGATLAVPVSFTAQPTFPQAVAPSETATLSYTIQNNVPVPHPLAFSASVTAGSIVASGGTCGSTLAASASCTKIFTYTAPGTGTASGSVSVNYNGQYNLTDNTLSFTIASSGTATMVVSPNPAGVAIGGISTTVNHAGTVQFSAVEIAADGTVNTSPSVTWTSAPLSGGAASIDTSSGLATGVTAGTVTITATDATNSSIHGSATLTVKAIGASQSGGYVYCMGTGTDITNCAYLPAGDIGGVIYPSNSDGGSGIQWYNGSFTTTNAISPNNGIADAASVIASQGSGAYAATACNAISPSGTWYLPARDELQVIGLNAVALNTALTAAGAPATNIIQTSYWSSTEYSQTINGATPINEYAWYVDCGDGTANVDPKDNAQLVRCVQAF